MKTWPYPVSGMTQAEILLAVRDDNWQAFRRSLKGITTEEKLKRLLWYRRNASDPGNTKAIYIRVDNYINALLRGGQLVREGDAIVVQR